MSDAVRSLIQFDASSKNHNKGVLSNADRKDGKMYGCTIKISFG